jgi:hypothetical protein
LQDLAQAATLILECLDGSGIAAPQRRNLAALLVSASGGASIQWFIDPRRVSLAELAKLANQLVESVSDAATERGFHFSKKGVRS